ncbi:MAG: hypothetical protein QXG97_03655 [Nitrososphaerota archaeon]
MLVLVLAFSAIMPCVEAAPTKDVLTEWTLPNSNSHPYNIVFEDNQVYFTEGAGRIGCLHTLTSRLIEWNFEATSIPLDLVVAGGCLYFTAYNGIWIGRLNPLTNEFTKWTLPPSSCQPSGIVANGSLIYFAERGCNKIGRLNLATSEVTVWSMPNFNSGPWDVAVAGSFIYFTERDGHRIGRLDPTTNEILEWNIPNAPQPFGLTIFDGFVFFTEYQGNKIGQLNILSNKLTEWSLPAKYSYPTEIVFDGHRVYFAEYGTSGSGADRIGLLNLTTGGLETTLYSTKNTIYPTTVTVTPVTTVVVPTSTRLKPSRSHVYAVSSGQFIEWSLAPSSGPWGIAVTSRNQRHDYIYFTEWKGNKIGRIGA